MRHFATFLLFVCLILTSSCSVFGSLTSNTLIQPKDSFVLGNNEHGTFKVKLKPGFAIGDIIPNTANIYFDTNPAIVTNTFNTQFVSALGNLAFETSNFLLVPNPASNFVQVYLQNNSENIKSIIIYDILGKLLESESYSIENKFKTELNVEKYTSGIYILKVFYGQENSAQYRFIKN